MDFHVQFLSFYVIQTDEREQEAARRYKHYKTLEWDDYEESEIKSFLDGEFARISKRKAELNPATELAPTKIGRFTTEPGHELESNPNYNLFQRLRMAADKEQFHGAGDEMVRAYIDTSAVRGGALIIATAKLNRYFDEPFLFVLKCDFESKIARISDESSLISKVEMAISARNIKSIQYPHMPELGMWNEWELKIHQASHARYFEDFLKYVSYEKSMPELVNEQVMDMVQQYMETKRLDDGDSGDWHAEAQTNSPQPLHRLEETSGEPPWDDSAASSDAAGRNSVAIAAEADGDYGWPAPSRSYEPGDPRPSDRKPADERLEKWAYSDKRGLQEEWAHEQVAEAAAKLVELQPELEMKLKLDGVAVRGRMADYGDRIHLARIGDRYAVLIVGDAFQFDKGVSPIELLQPDELEQVVARVKANAQRTAVDDGAPW